MATIRRKFNPDTIKDHAEGPSLATAIKTIRLCLRELYELAGAVPGSSSGGGGGGGGGGTTTAPFVVSWHANGPYVTGVRGTAIDGAWIVPSDCTITAIYLWRGTAGTSGQTVVDVNYSRAGSAASTLYVTQSNRPTLLFGDTDKTTHANLPDIVSLIAGDAITIDCDEKDSGMPLDFTLTLEAE